MTTTRADLAGQVRPDGGERGRGLEALDELLHLQGIVAPVLAAVEDEAKS